MARPVKTTVAVSGEFNYASLPYDAAGKVQASAARIRKRLQTSIGGIIEIGMDLKKVKAVVGHGLFGKWLRAEFGWSERTAENFMAVAERFGARYDRIANLPIHASAAYVLARPSVPDEARMTAIRRAESGERITLAVAKGIVASIRLAPCTSSGSAEHLGPRLTRLLRRYRQCWSPNELSAMVALLRQFLESFEEPGDDTDDEGRGNHFRVSTLRHKGS